MSKFVRTAAALAIAAMCGPVHSQPAADEPALRAAAEGALWPADIVRAADAYLQAYPEGAAAAAMREMRAHAAESWRLVGRNDVRLYRSAFDAEQADAAELRRAALGDRAAAERLAHASRTARRLGPYEGWLQYAALLGSERSSYELALYYRSTDQPLLASRYEAQAIALGYQPAAALDNIRK